MHLLKEKNRYFNSELNYYRTTGRVQETDGLQELKTGALPKYCAFVADIWLELDVHRSGGQSNAAHTTLVWV
jgi:hypothetical protein